jgi:hypothetical protein
VVSSLLFDVELNHAALADPAFELYVWPKRGKFFFQRPKRKMETIDEALTVVFAGQCFGKKFKRSIPESD